MDIAGAFGGYVHQQTSFPACTITDDDEFAANLGHRYCAKKQVLASRNAVSDKCLDMCLQAIIECWKIWESG